jgi:hypothetical protein
VNHLAVKAAVAEVGVSLQRFVDDAVNDSVVAKAARHCGHQFNERSGGVLNRTSLPSDVIAFVVFCRLRYRLTLRDLSEILLLRGIVVSHEAVRDWETKLLPVMGEELRKRRHGRFCQPSRLCGQAG